MTKEITAYHTEMGWMNPVRTIWMDGRPHPPAHAPHTWQGFSTGKWEGDMLTVTTTHLKPGYVRRNGLARSEKATLLEHFIRNGNVLTWISIVSDPVYLTEPYIKSRNFFYDPGYQMALYPCSVDIEVERPAGEIPHYLPGTQSVSRRVRDEVGASARGRARRRRDDVSRVPGEAEGNDAAAQAGGARSGGSEAMRRALLARSSAIAEFRRAAPSCAQSTSADAVHVVADTRERVHARRAWREHHRPDRP